MLEAGGEADLALEPVGAQGGADRGMEDLECDGAVVPEVLGEIDLAMPPRPSSRSNAYLSRSASRSVATGSGMGSRERGSA